MGTYLLIYCIAHNFGRVKPLASQSFYEFGEENVGEFTIAYISYFGEPGIWQGKILASGVRFAKFTKVFPTKILHYTVNNK